MKRKRQRKEERKSKNKLQRNYARAQTNTKWKYASGEEFQGIKIFKGESQGRWGIEATAERKVLADLPFRYERNE